MRRLTRGTRSVADAGSRSGCRSHDTKREYAIASHYRTVLLDFLNTSLLLKNVRAKGTGDIRLGVFEFHFIGDIANTDSNDLITARPRGVNVSGYYMLADLISFAHYEGILPHAVYGSQSPPC